MIICNIITVTYIISEDKYYLLLSKCPLCVTEFWVTTRFLQILLWESIFLGAGLALSGVSYQILGLDLVFPHLCITHKSISGQGTSFK